MHVHRKTDGLLLPTLALGLVTCIALYNQRSCRSSTDAAPQCDYSRQPYRFVTPGNGSDPKAWRLESRNAACPLRDLAGALANGSRPDGGAGQLIIFFQGDRRAQRDHLSHTVPSESAGVFTSLAWHPSGMILVSMHEQGYGTTDPQAGLARADFSCLQHWALLVGSFAAWCSGFC